LVNNDDENHDNTFTPRTFTASHNSNNLWIIGRLNNNAFYYKASYCKSLRDKRSNVYGPVSSVSRFSYPSIKT